ncbi:MAG TPA: hypothetical protein VE912_10310, partial [Bacteroidales bacterium]|nr:hypothetical protein [Bacteroidales bacterium]
MAIPNLAFSPPYDIHLLRGKSTNLKDLLLIGDDSATTYLSAHSSNTTLEFIPLFTSNPPTGNIYEIQDIRVNKNSGVVDAGASVPAGDENKIYNFIVIAKVTRTGTGADTKETYIRIQIHRSINSVWLSPERLTVQQGAGNYRFSIFARFDDDVVAEIANIYRGSHGGSVNYDFMSDYTLNFNCPSAPGLISSSGLITPATSHSKNDYPVDFTFGITSLGITKSTTATIRVDDQLSSGNTNIQAELVSTGNCPGYEDDDGNVIVDKIPNILFLPDGFTVTDLYAFDIIVDNFIADLVNGRITSPFNLLKGSINFWKVGLISDEQGATNRGEVTVFEEEGDTLAFLLPFPEKPGSVSADHWKVKHLVYHFGLPVKLMAAWGKTAITNYWKANSSVSDSDINLISEETINKWKKLSNRRLPEEKNTVLGVHINNYTAASSIDNFNHINYNSKRISRYDLDTFLATLHDTEGNLIGNQFLTNHSNPAPKAKDYDRIAIITAADNGRAINLSIGGFFVEIFKREYNRTDRAHRCKVTTIPSNYKCYIQVPKDIDTGDMKSEELSLSKKATMVHELGHSFGLEDEYGENPPSASFVNEACMDHSGWKYAIFGDTAGEDDDDLDWSANVQSRNDLLTPSGGSGQIDADKIKWRYDRIEKCGILREAVVKNGSSYKLRLRQGQGAKFSTGDIIRIRKSSANNPVAIVNRTASPNPANQSDTISRMVSANMQATVSGDEITVSGSLNSAFLTLGDKEQIIVYKPVFADDSPSTSSDTKEVISKTILDHIASDPFPFNAKEFSGVFKEIIDRKPRQDSDKLPGSLIHGCKSKKRQIVGLYSGGNTFHGSIYHPTGHCFMRNQTRWVQNFWGNYERELDEFCPVCKYALIDQID